MTGQNEFTLFAIITFVSVTIPVLGFLVAVIIKYAGSRDEKKIIKKLYDQKERSNGRGGSKGHY